MTERYLLVGYPGLVAKAVLRALLADPEGPEVDVLVETAAQAEALVRREVEALPSTDESGAARDVAKRVHPRVGKRDAVDLGLAGEDYMDLAQGVQRIVWCTDLSRGEGFLLEESPVLRGAAELVELARSSARLEGAVYLSSVLALGNATGQVSESELRVGQRFERRVEEASAVAEALVERAFEHSPLTIARAAVVLGDAETGECAVDGPLLRLVRACQAAPRVILASFRHVPVHVVSADYVARTLLELVRKPEARGERVHLVEPHPPTDARFFEYVATACERTVEERANQGLLARPQSPLMRLDGVEARALQGWDIRWGRDRAEALLSEAPEPVENYVPGLVTWCRNHHD